MWKTQKVQLLPALFEQQSHALFTEKSMKTMENSSRNGNRRGGNGKCDPKFQAAAKQLMLWKNNHCAIWWKSFRLSTNFNEKAGKAKSVSKVFLILRKSYFPQLFFQLSPALFDFFQQATLRF
ncbi:MAG: hypothetical protein E7620_06840 [Ruminococcaceae bacterium]|nr:hypothetical protein [Oscillospiraceae bacterium]